MVEPIGTNVEEGESIEDELRAAGVIRDGHFVLTSGRHSGVYVAKDLITVDPLLVASIGDELGYSILGDDSSLTSVNMIVAPVFGAVVIGSQAALQIVGGGFTCQFVYAEKDPHGGFVLRRGFDKLVKDKMVGIVEDILTTGQSVASVVKEVRRCGGEVVMVVCIWNRGNVQPKDVGGVPILSLVTKQIASWAATECPLCRDKVPVNTDFGHGASS